MATLILTTIGTAVGGPIGGAVGALLGNAVDARVLAPKGRQGPRLGDLSVQTSRYGAAIPKLFGRLRVAGTVIWATDLREDRQRQSAGKGRGSATTFSYSASFAVALSGRAIRSIGRIWAEGKLLRGAGGDWKSAIGAFRLHAGGEDEDVDPLIAAAEGTAPAYRGMAYAVFEDLQLADFGNRIPSLTFEVVADEVAVSIADVAGVLSGGMVTGGTARVLAGYAAGGDSARGAIEALTAAFPVRVHDDGARLILDDAVPEMRVVAATRLGATADGRRVARLTQARGGEAAVPDEVSLAYYEPERDWQAGLQRARRGGVARRIDRIELPAAMGAGTAKAAAERRLARLGAMRRGATIALPPAWMDLRPGERLIVPGLPGPWRVTEVTIERMAVIATLVAAEDAFADGIATPGRAVAAGDERIGATVLRVLDLPPLDEAPGDRPVMHVAAAGTGAAWRRAMLSISQDDGRSWRAIGATAGAAMMGAARGVLPPGDAALLDMRNAIDVELLHADMWLESRADRMLAEGANLAMLGDELIQFGAAAQIGPRVFRLTRLLRGRRGTEAEMAGHVAGEPFVLIERDTLLPVPLDLAGIGTTLRVQAIGIGDGPDGVETAAIVGGRALRPLSPVHLRAWKDGEGHRFAWVRRSRAGWAWIDGADAPIGEEREAYRVTLTPDVGRPRTIEVEEPGVHYSSGMRAADDATGAAGCGIEVRQIGRAGPGQAARAYFSI